MKMKTIYPCPACKGLKCDRCGYTGKLSGWNDRVVWMASSMPFKEKNTK